MSATMPARSGAEALVPPSVIQPACPQAPVVQ